MVVPEGAVVVPGSRKVAGAFAEQHGLQIATPLIRKYRDATQFVEVNDMGILIDVDDPDAYRSLK